MFGIHVTGNFDRDDDYHGRDYCIGEFLERQLHANAQGSAHAGGGTFARTQDD